MNTTTRRFSRSLAESFPSDRAYAIEVYRRPLLYRLADYTVAVLIGVGFVSVLWFNL